MPHEVNIIWIFSKITEARQLFCLRMVTSVAWGADPLDTVKPSLFSVGFDRVGFGWKLRGKTEEQRVA